MNEHLESYKCFRKIVKNSQDLSDDSMIHQQKHKLEKWFNSLIGLFCTYGRGRTDGYHHQK